MIIDLAANAGHSETDPGACDPVDPAAGDMIDTKEADWCRDRMREVCAEMRARGHRAVFIQNDSLAVVCETANAARVDVFVSLHLNAAENEDALGPETYFYTGSARGRKLAECVQGRLVKNLGAGNRDRGIKEVNFYVLKYTDAPAVLVEAGFVTNVWEEAEIHKDWYKAAVVKSIVDGVIAYMEERHD